MEDVLMEIVKNRVNEKVNTAVNETTVKHINDIMAKLKYIAEQAMDLLSIPQSQRSTYRGLVGRGQGDLNPVFRSLILSGNPLFLCGFPGFL